MKFIVLVAVVGLALIGCHRKTEPPIAPQTEIPSNAPASASAPPAPKYVTAVAENKLVEGAAGEVNAFLTQQLQIFIQQKQRLPVDFAELARTRLDSVPRPPEGKKWVIDTAARQVKAVSAQ